MSESLLMYREDDLNFVPLNTSWKAAFSVGDYRKQELQNMLDWANSEYDPEAKARAKKAYGLYYGSYDFAVGQKLARLEGVYDTPELWFVKRRKSIPQIEKPSEIYEAISQDFRNDARKFWVAKKEAEKTLSALDALLVGWEHEPSCVRVIAETGIGKESVDDYLKQTEGKQNAEDIWLIWYVAYRAKAPKASLYFWPQIKTRPFSYADWATQAQEESEKAAARNMHDMVEQYKAARAENIARLHRMNEEEEAARQKAIIAKRETEEAARVAAVVDCGFPAIVVLVVIIQGWRAARRGAFGDWRTWLVIPALVLLAVAIWDAIYDCGIARKFWQSSQSGIFLHKDYFPILRYSVTVAAALLAWRAIQAKDKPHAIVFPVAIALFFQPLVSPISISSGSWAWADAVAFVLLLWLGFIRQNRTEESKNSPLPPRGRPLNGGV